MGKDIIVLGYDGNYLSILFEMLFADGFDAGIRVITNDHIKRSDYPFQTNIGYEIVDESQLQRVPDGPLLLGSLMVDTRRFLFDLYDKKWHLKRSQFHSIQHASSVISSTVTHNSGLFIEPLSVISAYTRIGFAVSISRRCSIGHHCTIGDFTTLHPGVDICGHVTIGDNVMLGPGATVFNGVEIGDRSKIGGGSVVRENIPPGVLAAGNPCRVLKSLDEST